MGLWKYRRNRENPIEVLKYIFNLKKSTPSFMIYGELGIMPIYIDIKTRIIYHTGQYYLYVRSADTTVLYGILYNMHKNK